MPILHFISDFFAGALLCNSIPHLIAGLQGVPFPSPFAKPSGIGDSSPAINVLWGSFNLLVSLLLFSWFPVAIGLDPDFAAVTAGFVVLGLFTARHFGRVQRPRR